MAEDFEPQETRADAIVSSESTALSLAMDGASREESDRFLQHQRRLSDEQNYFLRGQVRPTIWSQWLGVFLRAATAVIGVVVAAGFAVMIFQASRSNGLLIQSFSLPPDLAQRGLTGDVVAAKLLDRLTALQTQTLSQRAPKSYANSWDDQAAKLDIPETGVSLGELDAFLRSKLGSDTHVAGEIVHTAPGLVSLTARASSGGAVSVSGPDTDIEALVQRLAEATYRLTQPYRYSVFLNSQGRFDESRALQTQLSRSGAEQDRPWAFNNLGLLARDSAGVDASLALTRQATALKPGFIAAWVHIATYHAEKSRTEDALTDNQRVMRLLKDDIQDIQPRFIPVVRASTQAQIALLQGDFLEAVRAQTGVVHSGIPGHWGLSADLARAEMGAHNLAAARAALADTIPAGTSTSGINRLYDLRVEMMLDAENADWAAALKAADTVEPELARRPGVRRDLPVLLAPLRAMAEAQLGRSAAARILIAATPDDCYDCLRARGRIAALAGDGGHADGWFARAVAAAPSIPFASQDWGRALLARGDAEAAIAQFQHAHAKGPHFADPLEGWGEALMAKNQSHLALAQFAEAEKYAANWARLHLKWGEALIYAGKPDQAQKQFIRAAELDLTAAERTELARQH